MPSCLYFSHPACLEHDPRVLSPGHPESPERLLAIEQALEPAGLSGWERRQAPAASEDEPLLVHGASHVSALMDLCGAGGGAIDGDTLLGPASCVAALHAVGGACAMTRALMSGEASSGFCAVRPPGHHAEARRAMGFCLFNNVAIAAELAIAALGARRVFIFDWDVHHGNGTAEIFRDRPDVLYASIHQSPFYPGSGSLHDAGSGAGEGYTINLPVAAGSDQRQWLSLLERVVLPAATAFEPDLMLISAGFDAHAEDPLADCRLQTASFAEMACRLRDMATGARVPLGAVLEGGYQPRVLGECVRETIAALGGDREAGEPVPETPDAVAAAVQVGRYWRL